MPKLEHPQTLPPDNMLAELSARRIRRERAPRSFASIVEIDRQANNFIRNLHQQLKGLRRRRACRT